jgi:hypothetical protein
MLNFADVEEQVYLSFVYPEGESWVETATCASISMKGGREERLTLAR